MKLIVGLGNPGEKYENTRHNVGFVALDTFLKQIEPVNKSFWDEEKRAKAQIKDVTVEGKKILLAKPHTFMNNSGFTVSALANYYDIKPEEIAVVYDDLDLPFGKIRIRFWGAAGGHKGVESIIDKLASDKFLRIRLGIGHPSKNHDGHHKDGKSHVAVEDYVLQKFAANEKSKVRHMVKETIHNISLITEHGIDLYMSKYNGDGEEKLKTKNSKVNTTT